MSACATFGRDQATATVGRRSSRGEHDPDPGNLAGLGSLLLGGRYLPLDWVEPHDVLLSREAAAEHSRAMSRAQRAPAVMLRLMSPSFDGNERGGVLPPLRGHDLGGTGFRAFEGRRQLQTAVGRAAMTT